MAALEHGAGRRLSGAAHGTRQISVNRSTAPATTQRILQRAARCDTAMYPANFAQRDWTAVLVEGSGGIKR